MSTFEIRPTRPEEAERLSPMTFGPCRHLLRLEPAPRLLGSGDDRPAQPVAFVAEEEGKPVGLVVGTVKADPSITFGKPLTPELLSIFVVPSRRRRGVGHGLLQRFERAVRESGDHRATAVYTSTPGRPQPIDLLLDRHRWGPPTVRNKLFRWTPDKMFTIPIARRMEARGQRCTEFRAVAWNEVTEEQIEALKRWEEEDPWIPTALVPWASSEDPVDGEVSLGILRDDQLVGWVLGHRLSDEAIRLTTSYMDQRRSVVGRAVPYWLMFWRRAEAAGYRRILFGVSPIHREMHRFVTRYLDPVCTPEELTESRERTVEWPPGAPDDRPEPDNL